MTRKRSALWSNSRSAVSVTKCRGGNRPRASSFIGRRCAGERFDLVILDLTLPGGMGGKEALKKLIEIDPTVNAIVSSGYAHGRDMSRYRGLRFSRRDREALRSRRTWPDRARSDRFEPHQLRLGLTSCSTPGKSIASASSIAPALRGLPSLLLLENSAHRPRRRPCPPPTIPRSRAT